MWKMSPNGLFSTEGSELRSWGSELRSDSPRFQSAHLSKKSLRLPCLKLTVWFAPENECVGRIVSFWDGLFSEAMLFLGSVFLFLGSALNFVSIETSFPQTPKTTTNPVP